MNEFAIPLCVRDESSLYASFDPSGLKFSSELADYLEDYAQDRLPGEKVCVRITAETEPDMGRFETAYKGFFRQLTVRNRREMLKSNLRALRLLVIGILFIILGLACAAWIKEVPAAVISTIGSFSVWEASAEWIETLPVLRKRDRILKILSDAGISYVGSDTK